MAKLRRRTADASALADIIRDAGLSYKSASKSFVFTCPKCKKPEKLWIFRDGSSFICFSCKESDKFAGTIEYALHALTGKPVDELRYLLYGSQAPSDGQSLLIDIDVDDDSEDDVEVETQKYIPDLEMPFSFYPLNTSSGRPGANYLLGRGIPTDIAMEYDIRYCPVDRAVIFPAWVDGRLVGWQKRIIDSQQYVVQTEDGPVTKKRIKAINSVDIPRTKYVVFQDRLKGMSTAVLCEGPVDALKCHFIGGNVCSLGKKLTDDQISTIAGYGIKKVVLGFDPDASGDFAGIAERLEAKGIRGYVVNVPKPYKDLGEMPLDAATEAVLAAEPLNSHGLYVYIDF